MKQILILGAGQSAPFMIKYLLDQAEKYDWFITVGDCDETLVQKAVDRHPRGSAVSFDINDAEVRLKQIEKSDLIINFLPPAFQYLIALNCIEHGKHMVTASYQDERMRDLNMDAMRKGVIILNEMGLDPGIDIMSAMTILDEVKQKGGVVTSFKSYGSGLPAPEAITNPLKYCITWNPRNVVMAGFTGAQYLYKGQIKILPHHEVFQRTWAVELDGVGTLEAYPNRDSLQYKSLLGLDQVHTMIRGTLRYPGWSETWLQIVRLGLPNETVRIPDLNNRTYAQLLEMFLPLHMSSANIDHRVANFLDISPTGNIMEKMRWLGLFSDEKISCTGETAADVLIALLRKKLVLPETARDMVAIVHEIEVNYPAENRNERITSTFIEYGEAGGNTAIAKTVGLPAAIAAKMIMLGEIPLNGCHIPTHPIVYGKVLEELKSMGLRFTEKVQKI